MNKRLPIIKFINFLTIFLTLLIATAGCNVQTTADPATTGDTSGTGGTGGTGDTGGGTGGTDTGGTGGTGGTTSTVITVSATTPVTYVWSTLTTGGTVYTDRSFTYTTIPSTYEGDKVLETANSDKASSDSAFVTFDIDNAATIYIGHDQRLNLPTWMADWTDTGEVISTSDTTFNVFKKDFSAGTVVLGGNEGSKGSMYVVFLDTASGSSSGGGTTTTATLKLDWNANTDPVNGYYIYYGSSTDTATTKIVDTAVVTGFNPSSPSLSFDAQADLGAKSGQQICFRVRAYNDSGASDYSNGICQTI